MELFYDLVFVVIQRLTHLLHDNPSVGRMWLTIGLTVLVWLAWFNVSAYINMSGGIGACGRPFVFASMAGMGVLSLGLEEMPEGHVRLFVIGYVIARLSIWPMWWTPRTPSTAVRTCMRDRWRACASRCSSCTSASVP